MFRTTVSAIYALVKEWVSKEKNRVFHTYFQNKAEKSGFLHEFPMFLGRYPPARAHVPVALKNPLERH